METPSISRTQDNVVMLCVQRGENNDFVVNNACITRNTQARGTGVRNRRSNKKQKKDVDTAHLKIVLSTLLNASIFKVCPSSNKSAYIYIYAQTKRIYHYIRILQNIKIFTAPNSKKQNAHIHGAKT